MKRRKWDFVYCKLKEQVPVPLCSLFTEWPLEQAVAPRFQLKLLNYVIIVSIYNDAHTFTWFQLHSCNWWSSLDSEIEIQHLSSALPLESGREWINLISLSLSLVSCSLTLLLVACGSPIAASARRYQSGKGNSKKLLAHGTPIKCFPASSRTHVRS